MKALIFGGSGQLGHALLCSAPAGLQAAAPRRSELEITDQSAIERTLDSVRPAVVINAAAYTAVDLAEAERDRAYAVNADALGVLASACSVRQVRLVHISTDFVFDGTLGRPYRPDDIPNPLNVYGASKLAGERHVAAEKNLDWRIIRTAWVYASRGRNFVLTMLRLFRERPLVRVVADQIGTPTSAHSLAECAWRAALDTGPSGMLHFTDAGVASWYDFAVATYEEAKGLGLITHAVEIVPIGADEYPSAARRPTCSVLEKRQTIERFGLPLVHWRVRLREVLKELQV